MASLVINSKIWFSKQPTNTVVIISLIIAFALIRLISLALYPLYDTTEARYGEMARIMVETQNWLTPQFTYDVPFWGKPPMHTWFSALSFQAFGISEFSARLPHLLMALLTTGIVFCFSKRFLNEKTALFSSIILISSIGFIIAGGMVMTDALLTFSVTLAMVSFWHNYQKSSLYGLVFFVALSLGMLIKGPVAVVIIGIALVTWSLINRCFFAAITSLPWLSGLLVFSILTFPWYILAEMATPGFLEYFLWGEHVLRFLEPGWQGDLYGSAHDEIKGTIWLFAIAMAFPWSFIALAIIAKHLFTTYLTKTSHVQLSSPEKALSSYLTAWLLAPMILFTFAGNILPAYVLPAIPAFAIWLAIKLKSSRTVITLSSISLTLMISAILFISSGSFGKASQISLISQYQSQYPLYYWQKLPFSGQFYSQGKAKLLTEEEKLRQILAMSKPVYLAIRKRDLAQVEQQIRPHCQESNDTTKYLLLRCN